MEGLLLALAPGQEPLAFPLLRLGLGRRPRVWLGEGEALAAGQLLHGLREGQSLAVLQPADGIGALVADEAMHPVGAGAASPRGWRGAVASGQGLVSRGAQPGWSCPGVAGVEEVEEPPCGGLFGLGLPAGALVAGSQ